MINPFSPFSGNYQPFLPEPVQENPGSPALQSNLSADVFQHKEPRAHKKEKRPWYSTFGKEVFINGLTIAASIAGGLVGGPVGAMAAGSITSAALGYADQKLNKQKVDWISVAIDGAFGLIPGTVAEGVAKGSSRLLGRFTGKAVDIGTQESVKRGVIVGATDGVVMGSVGGFSQGAYDSYKHDGKVNWGNATKEGFKAMASAVVGGALGAGAVMRMRRGRVVPNPQK